MTDQFSIYATNTEVVAEFETQTSVESICLSRPSFASDSWQAQAYFECSTGEGPELVFNSGAYRCSESVLTWTRMVGSRLEEYLDEGWEAPSAEVNTFMRILREAAKCGVHDSSIGERLDSLISRASRDEGNIDFHEVNQALASDIEDLG